MQTQPKLKVSYGRMPESNGKNNWTVILYREGDFFGGYTVSRSEYPDRERYEADCLRYLIGEIDKRPCILDYDGDLVSEPFEWRNE